MQNAIIRDKEAYVEDSSIWNPKMVEDRFREAILTLNILPSSSAKAYFNFWADIANIDNKKTFLRRKSTKKFTTTEEILKMNQTFEWMKWITPEERKLIWKRAENKHWKLISWELGCDRSTAWRKWVIACTKIATTLNARAVNGLDVATK